MKKRKAWTPEEDLELRRYLSFDCYTSVEIAEKLGRSTSAVNDRKHKFGLTAIKLSAKDPATVAQIVKFRMAGWTQKEIGTLFGVTHAYISQILRVNGFRDFCNKYRKQKRHSWTEVELALLRKYLHRGYTTVEIQQELPHRSRDAINQKRSIMTRYWRPKAETDAWRHYHLRWVNRTQFYIKKPECANV